jgi:hypothetical protein
MEKRILMSAICTGLCLFGANPAAADATTPVQDRCTARCADTFTNNHNSCAANGFYYPNGVLQETFDNADFETGMSMVLCSFPLISSRLQHCTADCFRGP